MMPKIYHLSTCSTCKKVIAALDNGVGFTLQDIKTEPITATQLDGLRQKTDSYASLFSRRARKYRSEGWHEKNLTEADYRRLILSDYTFLKRPALVVGDRVFAGSSKVMLEEVKEALANQKA